MPRRARMYPKPGQISIVSNISEYWDLTLILIICYQIKNLVIALL